MKRYIRFLRQGKPEYAYVEGDNAYPLVGDIFSSPRPTGEVLALGELELLLPCTPGKIVGVGLNYKDILLKEGEQLPTVPRLFLKSPQAMIVSGSPIYRPKEVQRLSCEVELAVVIGETACKVSEEEAMTKVWGYMVANDVTASDIQMKDVIWGRAKNYDTFLPVSMEVVTGIDPQNLHLSCTRNGETMIDSNTNRMICPIPRLISYISHVMTLCPGDMILTGTPTGYGVSVEPGDTVEVRIDEIGYTRNTIVS